MIVELQLSCISSDHEDSLHFHIRSTELVKLIRFPTHLLLTLAFPASSGSISMLNRNGSDLIGVLISERARKWIIGAKRK